jgi:hypothetical protein
MIRRRPWLLIPAIVTLPLFSVPAHAESVIKDPNPPKYKVEI